MTRWMRRLASFVRRRRLDDDLADEIRLHIELRREALVDAGMDPREAAYEARRMFGNVTVKREESREMWGFPSLETVGQDLRYAARLLRRSPMFAAVCVLSLGIGIGSAAAVFTLIDAVLLRKLPVANPDELVILQWHSSPTARMPAPSLSGNWTINEQGQFSTSFSLPTFEALRKDAPPNVRVFGFAGYMSLNIAVDGPPETGEGQAVSGNYFDALGLAPAAGRLLTESDDRPGAEPVAVISHTFWQRRFGGAPDAVGRVITVNATPITIVGVTPPHFRSTLQVGEAPLLAVPLALRETLERSPEYRLAGNWWVLMMARLPRGVDRAAAQPLLEGRFRQSVAEGNDALPEAELPTLEFLPGARGQYEVRDGTREPLQIMAFIVGIVLLVSCAIVANLLLARGHVRGREIAVRVAIGAPRARVVRQLLTEGLLLAALGSGCGLLVARSIAGALAPALTESSTELTLDFGVDWRIVAFTAALATLCTTLFALVPTLRTTDVHLRGGLQEQRRTMTTARRRGVLSNSLVVFQVALSVLLMTAAALLVRSVWKLHDVPAGFDASNLLIFRVDPTRNGHTTDRAREFYATALDRLAAVSGVRSTSLLSIPLIGGGASRLAAARPDDPPVDPASPGARAFFVSHEAFVLTVGENFFTTMGIPLLLGRAHAVTDTPDAQPVAVVNQALALQLFGTTEVLGRTFRTEFRPKAPLYEVVGVCANAKYSSLRRDAPPTAYFSYRQRPVSAPTFALKTFGDPLGVASAAREAMRQLDPQLPLFGLRTQEMQIRESLRRENLMARLATMLGLVTLLLSAIGLFGLLAYEVTRRTPEIGVRMALGAEHAHVRWMVIRQSLVIIGAGLLMGIPAAIGGTRVLATLLFGMTTADPASLAAAAGAMVLVGIAAAYLPARRASRVDPVVALRAE
jgi:predicted permease